MPWRNGKMRVSAACIRCMVERQEERVHSLKDESKKAEYLKAVLRVIGQSDVETSAPELVEDISKVYEEYFGEEQDFQEIKRIHNQKMLDIESQIWQQISSAEHPLERAILYACAGNYIDYGALSTVEESVLETLIQNVEHETLEETCYRDFCSDLERASKLVYVTDNCGEIVLDKQLIRFLKEQFPNLEITALVRGKQVLNDATIEDAQQIGLTELVPVMENGTGIAGASMRAINEESRKALENADVILAKGQGNFESLYGWGLNVYYLFLCKCDWFVRRFGLTKNAGVFMREGDY